MASAREDVHTAGVPVLCRSCEARHRGICGVLEPHELVELARHTHKARHDSGAELIAEGDEIDSYANVMAGVVKLSKVLEDGREQIVGLQFAPDFLGRLFGTESTISAAAASEVELCVVPKGALERLVAETPALGQRIARQTLRELDEAREWMVTLGRKSASERVASFLSLIATHADPAAGGSSATFVLPLTREEIGAFLGLQLETVSRQFSRLKAAGVIRMQGPRTVTVPDIAALKALCG